MAARSLIICVISLYYFCSTADGRVLPLSADEDTFQPLCSRMCHSSKGSRDRFVPPHKCSCSQSCAVYGDCCYDSPYKDTSSPLQFQFVCLHVEGKGEFQAVLSCPPHIRSDSCREQFGHMPPVTSRVTNVTYGNAFCATCNGDDEDLVEWNIELRCSSGNDWREFKLIINNKHGSLPLYALGRTWRSCTFYAYNEEFRILNVLEPRGCYLPEMVSTCSSTWRDPDWNQKCRSYEDPVYFGNTLFRNSHCSECNHMNLSEADCIPRRTIDMREHERVDGNNMITYEIATPLSDCHSLPLFFNQFDPDSTGRKSRNDCSLPKGVTCPSGENFDDATCACRRTRRNTRRRT